MARVLIPGALVQLFPGSQSKVDIDAASVSEVLDALNARWPGMRDRLCDSSPAIRKHISIFVDSEKATLGTAVKPDSRVDILPATSGG